jgi:hypothetical protein
MKKIYVVYVKNSEVELVFAYFSKDMAEQVVKSWGNSKTKIIEVEA